MSNDLQRAVLFAKSNQIIIPRDHEDLPLSVDEEDGVVAWIAFESPELGQQCQMIDPSAYQWGQMNGLQYFKFLHERIEAGGQHVLVINPGSNRQVGMNNESISEFLEWLDQNPNGLDQF
jgi:hypothetical protein